MAEKIVNDYFVVVINQSADKVCSSVMVGFANQVNVSPACSISRLVNHCKKFLARHFKLQLYNKVPDLSSYSSVPVKVTGIRTPRPLLETMAINRFPPCSGLGIYSRTQA